MTLRFICEGSAGLAQARFGEASLAPKAGFGVRKPESHFGTSLGALEGMTSGVPASDAKALS